MTASPDHLHRASEFLTGPGAQDLLAAAGHAASVELGTWRLRSVHHRNGRSVSAVYEAELRTGGDTREVLLVAHVDARGLPDTALVLSGGGHRVAVWRFPHDPFLPGLPAAVHRRRVRELLDALDGPGGDVSLRTRAYRPSRRAVVEVTVGGGEVEGRVLYLKVLAGRRASELAEVHRQLDGVVPVPSVIGVDRGQGIVALEALPGATLRSALVAGDPVPPAETLTALVGTLAGSGLESRRDPTRFADPTRHVELLRRLVPDAERGLVRAARAAADIGGPQAPVHGDLHDAQVLVEEGAVVGLLDVDGAGVGLVAQDLGRLVAHLEVVGEVWPAAKDRAESYATTVADAAAAMVAPSDLARGVAGAWLGLATGPYRAQEHDWPELTRQRIARAERWAELADDR